MKIMITGANGQLGRALAANDDIRKHELLLVSMGEGPAMPLDITDEAETASFVSKTKPDAIINCAAYTDVARAEREEELAFVVNARAVATLAKAAREVGARLIHISTDYVFDGLKGSAYTEEDELSPVNAYSRSKAAGEKEALAAPGALVLRSAWLYGEGKNFVRTMRELAKTHDELKVVNDQTGSPTSAAELARIVAFLLEKDAEGIVNAVCSGEATWYDLACEALKNYGCDVKVTGITSAEYGGVKRPAYTVLDNSRLKSFGYEPADWRAALKEYCDITR